MPRLIVVTGPPGSGKTTIAAALRTRLGLPLIAKDALKETLGDGLAFTGDRHASQQLGLATFAVQFAVARELLDAGVSLILEGNFLTGEWFEPLPPAELVQVHVTASPETLRERLLTRESHDHPVHYDREAADEIATRAANGDWGALPIGGRLVQIDTTVWPDLGEVLSAI